MRNNPHVRAVNIERVNRISPTEFYHQYIKTQTPVVITGAMDAWPAMQKWSFEYFQQLDATVCIEQGNVLQRETKFRTTQFSSYIQKILGSSSNGVTSNVTNSGEFEYLSVFDIFAAFPRLRSDVDFGLMANFKRRNTLSGWIGPAGTVTSYHIDWADNLFAQIVGRKRFHFVSPDQSKYMYPSKKYDGSSRISQVDPNAYDAERFPDFAKVNALTTTLEPGEMLYSPRGWWHHVESLEPSISVNNFGLDLKGLMVDRTMEKIKHKLHERGLLGKDCTCHMVVNGRRVARG